MQALTRRQEAVVACQGMPARDVAVHIGCTVHEVLELRDQLRRAGVLPDYPHRTELYDQLTLEPKP